MSKIYCMNSSRETRWHFTDYHACHKGRHYNVYIGVIECEEDPCGRDDDPVITDFGPCDGSCKFDESSDDYNRESDSGPCSDPLPLFVQQQIDDSCGRAKDSSMTTG